MLRKIIVGSRKSKLALTQTNWFINELKAAGVPFEFEVKEIVTKGDRILDVQLSKVGGKGLFVKEIEQALYDKEIDFAVHSMKDMPAVLPEGLVIGCIPPREDARDAFISKGHVKFADLPAGAVVGTSSLRRSAQLLQVRPDLEIKWIRGNVDTLNEFGTAIGGAVSNLAAVSYENAASADNTKDSADAMSVTMGELKEASVKLVELSKELEKSLGLFKL